MVALFEDRFERSYTLCGECWPKHIKKCPTCGGTGEIRTSGIGPLGKPAEAIDPCGCYNGYVLREPDT
jgi:hypothetical protein